MAPDWVTVTHWYPLPAFLGTHYSGLELEVRSANDCQAQHHSCPPLPQGMMGQIQIGQILHPSRRDNHWNFKLTFVFGEIV